MSIDARIDAVTVILPGPCEVCDGTGKDPENGWDTCPSCHGASEGKHVVRLKLAPREEGGLAGQDVLTIINPPTLDPGLLESMVGMEIWGGSGEIMVGETKWADRIGYTRIRLVGGE